VLWKVLRKAEPHFRRQAPFGAFVVDFVCHSARLVVEVDGGVHEYEDVMLRDHERAEWLRSRGYRVLRLTNKEVIDDAEGAVMRILREIGVDTPTPDPSPQGGGEF
jgi:very-short-patch-repair endonuclease